MKGLDTNVLLAWILEGQARPLPGGGPYCVSLIVLAELIWVLRSSLKRPKAEVVAVLELIDDLDEILVDKPKVLAAAISDWAAGPADFADYLLMHDHISTGARTTLTMDRRAARHPGFTQVT